MEGGEMKEADRERLKEEMMAVAEEVIDELLDWEEEAEGPTLGEIEEVVAELRERLGKRMAEVVVRQQEAVRPVPGPACPGCGEEMHYKGMKGVTIESRVGVLRVERGYYYCERCKRGLFPPG